MKRELKVKPHKSANDALEESEVDSLIFACKNDKERLVILTLAFTGMRSGEFKHMKREWIDWQDNEIRIPAKQKCGCSECRNEHRGEFWSPKTKSAVRDLEILDPRLKKILQVYFAFNKDVGLSKVAIFNTVKRVARKAGLMKRVYPHSLRATCATRLGHSKSAATVAYYMGWASYFTAEQYVQSQKKRAKEELKVEND